MRSPVLKRKPVLLLNHTIVSNVVLIVSCTKFDKLLVQMRFFLFSSIVPVGFVMSLSKLSSWGPAPGAVGRFGGWWVFGGSSPVSSFIYPLISNLVDLNPTSTEEK